MTYFGETLEGTGQAEDRGPNKESQQYKVLNKKKHSDELNSIHLSAIFLRFMSQPFL